MSILEAQAGCGVAIGYLDLEVVDSGKGYKNKRTTLVIRTFVPTTTVNTTSVPTTATPSQPKPQENKQLVGTGGAVAANNGYLNTTDSSNIPF